jgi:N6-adenosine-specific RNA methylase IME4
MSLADLKKLPVADWAAPDCVLFMWACDPLLPVALDVVKAWGFEFKTVGFYWVKQNRKSAGLFTGLGYWTRANPEQCLLATRGHPQRLAKNVPRVMLSPRREHSRKPDETIDRIERLVDGPYLEMFSRTSRDGWDAYGNEVDKYPLPLARDLLPI